jgi:hypothetical protein
MFDVERRRRVESGWTRPKQVEAQVEVEAEWRVKGRKRKLTAEAWSTQREFYFLPRDTGEDRGGGLNGAVSAERQARRLNGWNVLNVRPADCLQLTD